MLLALEASSVFWCCGRSQQVVQGVGGGEGMSPLHEIACTGVELCDVPQY